MTTSNNVITHTAADLNNFWIFIETLKFNSATSDAATIRRVLLKQLTPTTAETYREICRNFATQLFSATTTSNSDMAYLYAAYDAISQGRNFFNDALKAKSVAPLIEKVQPSNNLCDVFPTDDDYYGAASGSSYVVEEDYDDEE
jgi:hypothetical protein